MLCFFTIFTMTQEELANGNIKILDLAVEKRLHHGPETTS